MTEYGIENSELHDVAHIIIINFLGWYIFLMGHIPTEMVAHDYLMGQHTLLAAESWCWLSDRMSLTDHFSSSAVILNC